MQERIQKIIANSGYCSRRNAFELVKSGRVVLNGKIARLEQMADIDKDTIYVNEFKIEKTEKIYVMMNKPKGYEVTTNPRYRNVLELLPIDWKILPVGRLDKNTTGLLLFTNDGDFANKITHPRYGKEKTYFVKLDKRLHPNDMETIKKGIRLEDGWIAGKLKMYGKDQLEITISEGRKWILKRLFFKLGYYVRELSRTRIGNLKMNVKAGKWRFLTPKEVEELMK